MTDEEITKLMGDGLTSIQDLLFAYLAQLEIRLNALENILERKRIILAFEEIENEQESLIKRHFQAYIRGYDALLKTNRQQMLEYRAKHGRRA